MFLIFIISSCKSQLGTAISSTFKNVISGDAFIDSIADTAYDKLKGDFQQKVIHQSYVPICNPTDSLQPILGLDSSQFSDIKDKICSCEAWGTCDSKSCACDVLCPSDFNIFKKVKPYQFDSESNTLAFTNGDNKYSDEATYKGYCWGITLITQRFNRLATFTSDPKLFDGVDQEANRLNEYKKIISKINNNEPVTIPGFYSLYDFSSDPEVRNLLEDSAKDEWSKNALTTQGLKMVVSAKTPSKSEMEAMFDDIEFRLKNNMSPAIVYNEKTNKAAAHVLLVSSTGVNTITSERHLCLRDNNYSADSSMYCNIRMILKKNGTVERVRGFPTIDNPKVSTFEVGKVALAHSENSNTMEQVNNLHTKCNGEKDCNKN